MTNFTLSGSKAISSSLRSGDKLRVDDYELLQSVHDLLVQLVLNLGILGQDIGRVGQGRGRGFEPGQQKDVRLQFQTTDKEEKAFLKSTPVTVGTSFKAT